MLDIKQIRKNLDKVCEAIARRDSNDEYVKRIKFLHAFDEKRRARQQTVDALNAQIKENSRLPTTPETREKGRELKDKKEEEAFILKNFEETQAQLLLFLPNLPHPDVPIGDETNNRIVAEYEGHEALLNDGLDQVDLCKAFDLVDFERASKLAGSGFALFKGAGAKLARSLINYFLDIHTRNGYTEVLPPILVNKKTMTGTGQLPKFEEDMYHCEADDLYLIPTAEVPVTNIHADEVLAEADLPLSYCAYTPCFRREAGSYGKDTRGLMRLHQFNKVELVKLCKPEDSEKIHQRLLEDARGIVKRLGLKHRVVELATGDLGFSANRCYDIEVWAPVSKKWLEVSSVSNFGDFQARRANIRFREKGKKLQFVHTLNASGLALPRIMIALLEQYQTTRHGKKCILIPFDMRKYFGEAVIWE